MVESDSRTELLAIYREMVFIRLFEERCEHLFRDLKVRGSMHLCAGQEAVALGACRTLLPQDRLSFTYRRHGWALARGLDPVALLAECFGRETGTSHGRAGSKHLGDWSKGVLPANAIVGAAVPIAVGLAFAAHYTKSDAVSLTVFGDGAVNQGVVHEAMVHAAIWRLPVVFLCENNQYAELTPLDEMLTTETIAVRGEAYGMATATCDGMDLDDVTRTVRAAVDRARAGDGPTFVEAQTYRYSGHMTGDPQRYRTPEEVEEWRRRDPIVLLGRRLESLGVSSSELDEVRLEQTGRLASVEAEAWSAPEPDPSTLLVGAASWTRLSR